MLGRQTGRIVRMEGQVLERGQLLYNAAKGFNNGRIHGDQSQDFTHNSALPSLCGVHGRFTVTKAPLSTPHLLHPHALKGHKKTFRGPPHLANSKDVLLSMWYFGK